MGQIALAVLIQGTGAHPASWLQTGAVGDASTDIDYYVQAAQLAERGKFDSVDGRIALMILCARR